MKIIKLLLGFLFIALVTSCVTRVSLDHQSFINDKKVGVVVVVDSITVAKAGGQGILDIVLTPGNRFKEPLKKVEPRIKVTEKMEAEIEAILKFYKKPYQLISENLNLENLEPFDEKQPGKVYANKDYRKFKSTHQIDELMIISVSFGMIVSYYGMIEIGKDGFAYVWIDTFDLEDNSIIQKEKYSTYSRIKGNWKGGDDYEKLVDAIQDAVDKAVKALDTKI